MALHCLALLGSKNEPLFLCAAPPTPRNDAASENDESDMKQKQASGNVLSNSSGEDFYLFGFVEDNNSIMVSNESTECLRKTKRPPIRHEIMMHAALDRLEELLGTSRTSISYGRFQRGSHWLGSICPMEEFEIYGYTTSSDVKILALIERGGIIPLKKRKEIDIKILFTAVHECYVKYTLNPFSKIRSKIEPPCEEFEEGILSAIQQYNQVVSAT